mgnify:CR=1 FL=1
MKKLVVYCHGYGSSANTDKVARLKAKHEHVYAWDINIDPEVSIPALEKAINDLLVTDMHDDAELVFVGTSLGGWYASVLAEWYDARAIVVNPCYNPQVSLAKYGVDEKILKKYGNMPIARRAEFVIAADDEVLDFAPVMDSMSHALTVSATGGHRFNGPEFEALVSDRI